MKNQFLFVFSIFLVFSTFSQSADSSTLKNTSKEESIVVPAQFPGGNDAFADFIINNFNYPKRCKRASINGSVKLQFIVDTLGYVINIKVIEETNRCPEYTAEAIRVIKKSKWNPGSMDGEHVNTHLLIPIELDVVSDAQEKRAEKKRQRKKKRNPDQKPDSAK